MVTHKGFSTIARVFGVQCSWCGCYAQNVSALNGNIVRFPVWRENQMIGDSTRTKKLNLQYKVTATGNGRLHSGGYSVQARKCNSLCRNFFSSFLCTIFFFSHPPLHDFLWFFPTQPLIAFRGLWSSVCVFREPVGLLRSRFLGCHAVLAWQLSAGEKW